MSDHEDHTTDERATETSTDSGAQNMPSANTFADMFKAALAPVLNQLTNLNENASSVLLNRHDDSDEDGETASNDGPAKSCGHWMPNYPRSSPLWAKMTITSYAWQRLLEGTRAGLNSKREDLSAPSQMSGAFF